MTFPPKVWNGVLRLLQDEVPEHACRAWLEPLVPDLEGEVLRLHCPSSFHRDRIRDRYLSQIVSCAQRELGAAVSVELDVGAAARNLEPEPARSAPSPKPRRGPPRRRRPASARTSDTEAAGAVARSLRSASLQRGEPAAGPALGAVQHEFDTFVVGSCNALAREASIAMARDQQESLSQLFIAASSGLGKTHLARAVVNEARRHGARQVVYASAESFTNDFMSSVRGNKMSGFKQRYRRDRQLLVVEDVQFLAGKAQTQLEFFYTVRHALESGGRVLLTGNALPQTMTRLDDQVRGQLASGFVARLEAPDAQARRDILRAKASGGGVHLPDDCVDELVEQIHGSGRDLEAILIQLVTMASLMKRPIDLALTREALATRAGETGATPTALLDIDHVIQVVASSFKTTPETLASRSRRRDILVPRQLAMYLAHRFTEASLAEIGRAFDRSHPAVKNAITRVEREIAEKAKLRYQVEALVDRLRSGGR